MDMNLDESFNSFLPGNKHQQQDNPAHVVEFHVKPKLMGFKSREAGREIKEDREYCKIMVKGQPQQVVDEEVTEKHKRDYPNAYAAFKAGRAPLVVGTPIEQLPGMGPSQALELKVLGIRVMEDMANLDDSGLQRVGHGGRELQKQCKAFLARTTGENIELKAENAKLKTEVQTLTEQMARMQEQIAGLVEQDIPRRKTLSLKKVAVQ